ncbi:MAG: hypothetical protein ACRDRJ_17605 [Streptosporangiaceae bacterium]
MDHADLPVADIDQLEALWRELFSHHLDRAPHLETLGPARSPAGRGPGRGVSQPRPVPRHTQ